MATPSDVRIDPPPEEFVAAVGRSLGRAVTYYTGLWDSGPPEVADAEALRVLARVRDEAEGWFDWLCRQRVGARVVWWTDHVGRKHVRVRSLLGLDDDAPGPFRPPLMALYPGPCVGVHRFGRMRVVAVCDCGAWGDPVSLGWMGPTCGPCSDRDDGERLLPDHWQAAGSPVERVAVSADGRVAAWADHAVTLWQAGPPRLIESWGEQYQLGAVGFSPAGNYLAWEEPDRVQIHDLTDRRVTSAHATRFAFHPDGRGVFLFSPPESLVLWDLGAGARRVECRVPYPVDLRRLAASPDGRRVAGLTAGWVLIWNAHTGEPVERVPTSGSGEMLEWSPDGATLAVGEGGAVRFLGAMRGQLSVGAGWPITGAAYHPGGAWLMTASQATVRVWTVRSRAEERSMAFEGARCFAVSPDGATLAVGTQDGRVRLVAAAVLWEG
ncbi:MAG: WD40 repeat domain-containing protein [Gemmataceae bacterium]